MIKGIIFDMDGVLINSKELYKKFEVNFFRNISSEIDIDFLENFTGSSTEALVDAVVKKYNITVLDYDTILRLLNEGEKLIYTQNPMLKLYDDIMMFLDYFVDNKYKIIIASSSSTETIKTVLERFELESYFSKYIGQDTVKNVIPAPDIFIKAAELLELNPDECIVFEDSTNGIKAAKEAGCTVIGFLNEGKNTQDIKLSDFVLDKFSKDRIPMIEKFITYCNKLNERKNNQLN